MGIAPHRPPSPGSSPRGPSVGPCTSTWARTQTKLASTSMMSSTWLNKVRPSGLVLQYLHLVSISSTYILYCTTVESTVSCPGDDVNLCSSDPQTLQAGGPARFRGMKASSLETMWRRSDPTILWVLQAWRSAIAQKRDGRLALNSLT